MITPSSIALTGLITWALLLLVLMEVIRSQLVLRRNFGVWPQMRIFDSLGKNWRQRALFVLTLILVVLFASHPELRLLVPIIDALGVDLFLVLIGGQTWAYLKPFLHGLYRHIVLPAARRGYSVFIFFFGDIGPYVDANISTRFQRFVPAA